MAFVPGACAWWACLSLLGLRGSPRPLALTGSYIYLLCVRLLPLGYLGPACLGKKNLLAAPLLLLPCLLACLLTPGLARGDATELLRSPSCSFMCLWAFLPEPCATATSGGRDTRFGHGLESFGLGVCRGGCGWRVCEMMLVGGGLKNSLLLGWLVLGCSVFGSTVLWASLC